MIYQFNKNNNNKYNQMQKSHKQSNSINFDQINKYDQNNLQIENLNDSPLVLPKIVHKKLEQESRETNKILRTIERKNERKLKQMKNNGYDFNFVLA